MSGTVLDFFNNPSFSPRGLTESINIVPNTFGRLNALGLFPIRGLRTTYATIEYRNGVINLLPTRQRGAPSTLEVRGRRNVRMFDVPHIPHNDSVLAADIQNAITFGGGENALASVQDEINDRLESMTAKHFSTLEWLRMGALKGTILDADGSTILNLFTEFGITQHVEHFAFGNALLDMNTPLIAARRYLEDNLQGESMTGVRILASSEWFDAFVAHPSIKEAYDRYSSRQEPLRNDLRRGFVHKDFTIEEYRATASYLNLDGTTTTYRYIAAGEAHLIPEGTQQTFRTYIAPPNNIDEVNMAPSADRWIYSMQEPLKFKEGIEIHTESNPLPICMRPALLVKLDSV